MLTMTSREFNQDASAAKRAAKDGPVFITDRGKPAHVMLSIEAYKALTTRQNIMHIIGCDAAADIDFVVPVNASQQDDHFPLRTPHRV